MSYPQKERFGIVYGNENWNSGSKKTSNLQYPDMKNSTGNFIKKLIEAIPSTVFFSKDKLSKNVKQPTGESIPFTQEENLNRIFMVRYRIQHL